MGQLILPASSFDFMRQLKQNNNREWFAINKEAYQQQLELVEDFTAGLLNLVNTHDVIETPSAKKALHRIYRDIRFSKDKTPFKTNWSGNFKRAGKHRRGGYYFHLEPGNTFIAGGFWAPDKPDLKRIRDDIAFDPSPLKQIINSIVLLFRKTIRNICLALISQIFRLHRFIMTPSCLPLYHLYLTSSSKLSLTL